MSGQVCFIAGEALEMGDLVCLSPVDGRLHKARFYEPALPIIDPPVRKRGRKRIYKDEAAKKRAYRARKAGKP